MGAPRRDRPVRACGECGSRVHLCETGEQVYRHAQAGRAVVFVGRRVARTERLEAEPPDPPSDPPSDPPGVPQIFQEMDVPPLRAGAPPEPPDEPEGRALDVEACPRCGGAPCVCRDPF